MSPIPGLPPGLALSSAGVISGVPTAAGVYQFGVTVTDSAGNTASATLTLTVVPQLSVTVGALPGGTVGQAYTFTLTPTGGEPPFTWTGG